MAAIWVEAATMGKNNQHGRNIISRIKQCAATICGIKTKNNNQTSVAWLVAAKEKKSNQQLSRINSTATRCQKEKIDSQKLASWLDFKRTLCFLGISSNGNWHLGSFSGKWCWRSGVSLLFGMWRWAKNEKK